MPHKRKFTLAEEVQIATLYDCGFLQRELTERFGCGTDTLRLVLQRQNVAIRGTQKAAYIPTPAEIKAGMSKIRSRNGMAPCELTLEYEVTDE